MSSACLNRFAPGFVVATVLLIGCAPAADSPAEETPQAPAIGVGVPAPEGADVLFDVTPEMLHEKWTYWEGPRFAAELPIKWPIVEDPVDGGTVVSSALELMHEIIQERYPTSQWNIYAAQASDGDNWEGDSPACSELLAENIMPYLQYFAYVEITAYEHQSLWYEYEKVAARYPNFAMQEISGLTSIYPVFRELFSKEQQAAWPRT